MPFTSWPAAPTLPLRSTMTDATFQPAVETFLGYMADIGGDAGIAAQFAADLITAASSASYSTLSTSAVSIGLGLKVLTVESGRLFVPGQDVVLASAAAPSTNRMAGVVESYNIATGVMSVTISAVWGAGTYADWFVAIAGQRGVAGDPNKGGVDVQAFSSSGTWSKPAYAALTIVELIGGGGGGGSGQRSGGPTYGGLGGAGGGYNTLILLPGDLAATETVTIGSGGAGGAAKTVNGAGNDGGQGGNTVFGSLLTAFGGALGPGGTTGNMGKQPRGGGGFSAGAVDSGGEPLNIYDTGVQHGHFGAGRNYASSGALDGAASGWGGGNGGSSTSSSPAAGKGGCSLKGGCGGGMGGFYDTGGGILIQPAAGGSRTGTSGGGGTAGVSHATAATAGGTPTQHGFGGGGGGGTSGAGVGAAGGAGAARGGGGGGGGGTAAAQDSGAGGAGGAGYARIVTLLMGV